MHKPTCAINRSAWKTRVGDILVVILVLAAAVASMLLVSRANAGVKGSLAVVEVNGKVIHRFTLGPRQASRRVTVKGPQGDSTLEIKDGRVRMVESACRDKICIGMGWIDTNGRSIVCLPNRVVIRVTGSRKPGVDTVTE